MQIRQIACRRVLGGRAGEQRPPHFIKRRCLVAPIQLPGGPLECPHSDTAGRQSCEVSTRRAIPPTARSVLTKLARVILTRCSLCSEISRSASPEHASEFHADAGKPNASGASAIWPTRLAVSRGKSSLTARLGLLSVVMESNCLDVGLERVARTRQAGSVFRQTAPIHPGVELQLTCPLDFTMAASSFANLETPSGICW